ncbi:MAG: hypothetical protein HP493_10270 [Nitrospira sp.]|nr:hypothetical protein [Nitrospira sp.]
MGKRPLGLGLIGVGRHGLRYARHILHDLPSVSLKAVCRRNPAQGLDLPGAESVTVYGQARALIEDPAVEAITTGSAAGFVGSATRTVRNGSSLHRKRYVRR